MKLRIALSLLLLLLAVCGVAFAQRPEPIPQLGHTSEVTAGSFALNGKIFISSSRDNVTKLWNTETGELLQTLEDAAFVAVSPNGRTLLTVEARELRLRDLQTGRVTVLKTEPISKETYSGEYSRQVVAFSPDGEKLLRVGSNPGPGMGRTSKGIQVWNLSDSSYRFIPLAGDYDYASATFSPDAHLLIAHNANEYLPGGGTRKKQGMVRVLEAETGREMYTLKAPPGEEIESAYLSPDKKILVSRSELNSTDSKYQTTLIFADARTGRELHRVKRGETGFDVTFSPQGSVFASISSRPVDAGKSDSVITIADAATGKVIHQLPVGETRMGVESISFAPDGKTLAAAFSTDDDLEKDSQIQLWEVASGERGRSLNSKKSEAHNLTFSPDGRLLAGWGAFYSSDSIEVWEVAKGERLPDFAGHGREIQSLEFSPDNKVLIIAEPSLVLVWSLTSGAPLQEQIPGEFRTFSKDGKMFVVEQTLGTGDRRLTRLWDSSSGAELHSFEGAFLSLSDDGKRIFTVKPAGGIAVSDVSAGKEVRTLAPGTTDEQLRSTAISPDGQYLAIVRNGSTKIELISVETGRVLKTLAWSTGPGAQAVESQEISLAFSPDSQLLASTSGETWNQHTIRMWRLATARLLYKVTTGLGAGVEIAFSPDGRTFASTGNQIDTWDALSGRHLHAFDVSSYVFETAEYGTSAFFSPNGRLLAGVVGGGRTVNLVWDAVTGRQIPLFKDSLDEASVISFSPDTKYVAALGRDRVIRFWRVADRQLLGRLFLFDGGGWLVMKPGGSFDGSPEADSKLLWRRSPNPLDVTSGEGVSNQFRSPHLLADIFSGRRE